MILSLHLSILKQTPFSHPPSHTLDSAANAFPAPMLAPYSDILNNTFDRWTTCITPLDSPNTHYQAPAYRPKRSGYSSVLYHQTRLVALSHILKTWSRFVRHWFRDRKLETWLVRRVVQEKQCLHIRATRLVFQFGRRWHWRGWCCRGLWDLVRLKTLEIFSNF